MKLRVIALIAVLAISFITQAATAGRFETSTTGMGPNAPKDPFGKDLSENVWNSWQVPFSQENLTHLNRGSDSAAPGLANGFSERRLEQLFDAGGSPSVRGSRGAGARVESAKPIETVAAREENPVYNPQPAAVAPRKSDTKRIILIVGACVALLAFRKARRSQAGSPSQKPGYL